MKDTLRRLFMPGLVLLTLAVVASLPACSGGYGAANPTTTSKTSAPAASGNSVSISGFAFSPATLTVSVGTTVTWTNNDSTTHTITSDTGVFNSGNVANGKTYSYKFTTAGTYAYHCSIHSYMKGTVIVQ